MPLFHFNVHHGGGSPDEEGTDLADPDCARVEAIRLAGILLAENAHEIGPDRDWQMDVTDDAGLTLFRLHFSVAASASVPRST